MHLATVLGIQAGIAEILQERGRVIQHRSHSQQAVKPVPELPWKGFADPMSGIPVFPEFWIYTVAEGGERHNASIQPGVAYIRDAPHFVPTFVTGNHDSINEWTMGCVPLEVLITFNGPLLQLLVIPDDMEMTAILANPDRQGQSPIAFLGDHPVVHIAQPILLTSLAKFWYPADLVHNVHDLVAQAGLFLFLS